MEAFDSDLPFGLNFSHLLKSYSLKWAILIFHSYTHNTAQEWYPYCLSLFQLGIVLEADMVPG